MLHCFTVLDGQGVVPRLALTLPDQVSSPRWMGTKKLLRLCSLYGAKEPAVEGGQRGERGEGERGEGERGGGRGGERGRGREGEGERVSKGLGGTVECGTESAGTS